MTDINARFENAVKLVNAKPADGKKVKIDMKTKLMFYALYKQATEGPCKGKAPSRADMAAYYKHLAWTKCKDMSKDEAKTKYLELAASVMPAELKSKL